MADQKKEESSTKQDLKYESIFEIIGEFGRFQLWYYLILCLPAILNGFQLYGNSILIKSPERNFSCNCISGPNVTTQVTSSEVSDPDNVCNFTREDEKNSVVAYYRLVCEKEIFLRFTNIVVYCGMFCGSFIAGVISDRFGRVIVIQVTLILLIISSGLISLPINRNFYVFLILRFITGASILGMHLGCYVLGMELMSPRWRLFAGVIMNIVMAVGIIIAGFLGMAIQDWRFLGLALSLPGILIVPLSFVLPESPRWLLNTNCLPQLEKVLIKAAKMNKRLSKDENESKIESISYCENKILHEKQKISANAAVWTEARLKDQMKLIVQNEQQENQNATKVFAHDLFRSNTTRVKSLIIFFNWMVASVVFFGVTLSSARLTVNPVFSVLISGSVEVLAYLALFPILNSLGRRIPYSCSMLATGIICFSSIFTKSDLAAFVLSMIGKFFISAAFSILYIFSAELFPTVLRNTGMGISSVTAKAATMLAPVLVDFAPDGVLPLVVFGCCSGAAGLLSLSLPETAARPLPETLEEADRVKLQLPFKGMKPPCMDQRGVKQGVKNRGFETNG